MNRPRVPLPPSDPRAGSSGCPVCPIAGHPHRLPHGHAPVTVAVRVYCPVFVRRATGESRGLHTGLARAAQTARVARAGRVFASVGPARPALAKNFPRPALMTNASIPAVAWAGG
jgi:hypothetical protein